MSEKRRGIEELNGPLKAANSLYYSLTQILTELNNKISLKRAENVNNEARRERLEKEQADVAAQRKNALVRVGELSASISRTENSLKALKTEVEQKAAVLSVKEAELRSLQSKIAELSSSITISEKESALIKSEIDAKSTGGKAGHEFMRRFGGKLYKDEAPGIEGYIFYNDLFVFDDDKKYAVLMAAGEADFSFRFVFRADLPFLMEQGPLIRLSEGLYHCGGVYKKTGRDDAGFVLMELEARLVKLTESISAIRAALAAQKSAFDLASGEVSRLREEYGGFAPEIRQAEIRLETLKTSLTHGEDECRRLDRGADVVEKELTALLSSAAASVGELDTLEQKRTDTQGKRNTAERERADLEGRQRDYNELLDKDRRAKNTASEELARYTERAGALEREITRLQEEAALTDKNINELDKRLLELADKSSDVWKERRTAALAQKNEIAARSLIISDKITAAERMQGEKDAILTDLRKNIDEANSSLRELDRAVSLAESRLEAAGISMEELSVRMWEEYSEILSDVWMQYSASGRDLKRLNAEKTELEEEIAGLGPLNMAVDNEYEEKKARFESQKEQMADIERSAENLTELIKEIDESTVQLFADTFTAVQKNFSEVFTRFFGSGNADLILTNPSDMLTTGVELKVNPPGKKISNNNLLSGGEKALAALTLLFSLFLQKPTPFCFLDEVDAPLDDENAGRFISMLKLLSGDTQFIVITHKHKTMAAADSLYGITMQEGGVSSVLSVELA
jgi:chromosome segregation protein